MSCKESTWVDQTFLHSGHAKPILATSCRYACIATWTRITVSILSSTQTYLSNITCCVALRNAAFEKHMNDLVHSQPASSGVRSFVQKLQNKRQGLRKVAIPLCPWTCLSHHLRPATVYVFENCPRGQKHCPIRLLLFSIPRRQTRGNQAPFPAK